MKKNLKRVVALALTAVVAAGSFALPAEAANKTISRVGNKNRSYSTGSEFELEVRRNGGLSENKVKWTIGNTSIVKYDDDDRYDDEMEFRAVKKGTTTITAKNLVTGGKISYKITVKSPSNTISRVGDKSKSLKEGKQLELSVKKNGNFDDSNLEWVIADSSIVRFEDNEIHDNEVEIIGLVPGKTTVTCKNLLTGGKIDYNITVKKDTSGYLISRVGNKTKYVEKGDDIDVRVSAGSKLGNDQIKWTISNTSILRFEDGDNYGPSVEVEGRKTGTVKLTAKNLHTGGKIVYTIKVTRDYDD